jgi:dolichol kinase
VSTAEELCSRFMPKFFQIFGKDRKKRKPLNISLHAVILLIDWFIIQMQQMAVIF